MLILELMFMVFKFVLIFRRKIKDTKKIIVAKWFLFNKYIYFNIKVADPKARNYINIKVTNDEGTIYITAVVAKAKPIFIFIPK